MPLRFDQPELLGKWEGDSAPLHQAIANIGKGGSVLGSGLEKQKPKTPSYKIDPVKGSPFKKDNDKVGMLVGQAIDAVNRGENPEPFTAKAAQITNTGLAQKNALDQIKLQVNELQQTYPDGVVNPIPVNDNINSAYNDHDDETRDQAISEAANNLKDPSVRMINTDKFYANKLLKMSPISVDYTDKDEFGNVNVGSERKVSGRLLVPDTKRPQFDNKNGKKVPAVDANGQPIYQLRPAETVDDVIPLVRGAFGEDPIMAQWKVNQVLREDKKSIDDITNEWISSERNRPDGGVPDKETIEAKRQIIARDLAEKKIARQWLQSERPTTVLNNTRTLDEPSEADKDRAFSKSWGANGSYSTTFTSANDSGNRDAVFFVNGDKKEGEIKTYGELGIARRDKNNEPKPVIVRTDEGAWNASRGEHIKQGLEMNVGGIVLMAIDKKTGMPKPTNKSAAQLKKEGYEFAPFIEGKMLLGKENKAIKKEDVADYEKYVTLNNKPYLSTDNNGVNEQEEFDKLEAKFAKQGQSSYVMKKLDNKITNQLAKKDIDGFFNLNDENRKIKKQLDELNKGVVAPTGTNAVGLTKGGQKGLSDKEVEANKKVKEGEAQKGSFNDIYGKNHMTYVDVASKHTGSTDELLSKFADWEKKNEGGNGGGYNWGTNDSSIDTKEKAIAKYKKEYLPMVKDLPDGVKNIGLQQAINIGDPWGAALTAAGIYDEKGNSSTAGVRGDNRRAKKQEAIYKANQKAVFDSYNKDPEAFKQRYSKAVKYHYDNAKPLGSSNTTEKKAEALRKQYGY